jgi:hypothetical protein
MLPYFLILLYNISYNLKKGIPLRNPEKIYIKNLRQFAALMGAGVTVNSVTSCNQLEYL